MEELLEENVHLISGGGRMSPLENLKELPPPEEKSMSTLGVPLT